MTKAATSRFDNDCNFDSLNQDRNNRSDGLTTKLNIEVFSPSQSNSDSNRLIDLSHRASARDNSILPAITVAADGNINITINSNDLYRENSRENSRGNDHFNPSSPHFFKPRDVPRQEQVDYLQILHRIQQQLFLLGNLGPQNLPLLQGYNGRSHNFSQGWSGHRDHHDRHAGGFHSHLPTLPDRPNLADMP